ncbi:hypothetical protein [Mesorhizobium sp.]|uniref:hypothetical protein n=1 Tax=Mesorhizobium sp. TaxID=1871066 RepID=UPI00257EAB94|nr:hypothetical protein [Mesorhizobium sp.]
MGLNSLAALIEIEIQRLRFQVENLESGSLDHARISAMLDKALRDHAAAIRLLAD